MFHSREIKAGRWIPTPLRMSRIEGSYFKQLRGVERNASRSKLFTLITRRAQRAALRFSFLCGDMRIQVNEFRYTTHAS